MKSESKFLQLCKSEDGTLLFGQYQGSAKLPYSTSVDRTMPEKPVFRCSCPSRQFPCKHGIALLDAYTQGRSFTVAPVPADLQARREKAEKRVEKQKSKVETPRKVNKTALAKKIAEQIKGIALLETLLSDIVRSGLGNVDAKVRELIEEQIKQLGNLYLPGAQDALRGFSLLLFDHSDKEKKQEREAVYEQAVEKLAQLHSLCRQGREYLEKRLEDPDLKPETESTIAAWLGHVWQLTQMRELGLVEADVELVQLSFHPYDDRARAEFVETGTWVSLKSGRLFVTHNYRPYKAARHIREEDSFFNVAQIQELFIYPGEMNPRVRWEAMTSRPAGSADFQKIRSFARSDYPALVKEVKNQIKAPLADKHPLALVSFAQIGKIGEQLVIANATGERLILADLAQEDTPSCPLLPLLPPQLLQGQALLVRFHHDSQTQRLAVKPLSLVTESSIIRFIY